MNELTLTKIRLHFGGLTKYFNTLAELKNYTFDHPGFRFVGECFVNNDWKEIAL
jgi:hypothetical protein